MHCQLIHSRIYRTHIADRFKVWNMLMSMHNTDMKVTWCTKDRGKLGMT